MLNQLTILIPCFNEEGNIPLILPDLISFARANNFKIIIVNDGSTDNSKNELLKFGDIDFLKIINHKLNRGYGAALKSGILDANTEYIITLDADGQHYLEDVMSLFNIIREEDADMVVGSRINEQSPSYIREFGKSLIRLVARMLMHVPVHDINSGMKIYRAELAKKYIKLYPDGMSFSDIIALVFISKRHLVLETPIKIKERIGGKSTISYRTAFETVSEILNMVILFNPLKIFFPLSVFFFFISLLWGIQFIIAGKGLSVASAVLLIISLIVFLLGLLAEQISAIRNSQAD